MIHFLAALGVLFIVIIMVVAIIIMVSELNYLDNPQAPESWVWTPDHEPSGPDSPHDEAGRVEREREWSRHSEDAIRVVREWRA
jgi:hypothetical protein